MVFEENVDFKHVVLHNQQAFDEYFDAGKTMNNKVDGIDFQEYDVIGIITKPSIFSKKIEIVYSEINQDSLYIQNYITRGDKSSHVSTALCLATIPKGMHKVLFKSKENIELVEMN